MWLNIEWIINMKREFRHLQYWRKAYLYWFPLDWAYDRTLLAIADRIGKEGVYDVFSYLYIAPNSKHNSTDVGYHEIILPSDICPNEMHIADAEGGSYPGRVRHPRPGTIESCALVREFNLPTKEASDKIDEAGGISRMRQREISICISTRPGLSKAYLLKKEGNLGNFDLHKPVELLWQSGERDDDTSIATLMLRDGSYVRIFPAVQSSGKIHNWYKWPFFYATRRYSRSPRPGEKTISWIMWTMAKDGRPVGYAFPL